MPYRIHTPSELESLLDEVEYPISKNELIAHAIERGAQEDMVQMLEGLPLEALDGAYDAKTAISLTRL